MADMKDVTSAVSGTSGSWMSYVPFLRVAYWMFSEITQKQAREEARAQHEKDLNWQADQAEINRDFQTSERLAAQEFDVNMWNVQNEYNSPEQQVSRLENAGINPNAMFGGSSPVNTTSSAPRSNPASGSMATAISSLAPLMLTAEAQNKQLLAQSRNLDSITRNNSYDLSYNVLTQDERYKALVLGNRKLGAEGDAILADAGLKQVDAKVKEGMFEWYSRLSEEDLKIKRSTLVTMALEQKEALAKIDNLIEEKGVIQAQKILFGNQAEKEKAATGLINQQTKTEAERTELVDQQTYESINRTGLLQDQMTTEEIGHDIQRVLADFSQAMEMPLGTPEYQMNFFLWRKNQMWSYYNKLAMKGLDSLSEAPGRLLGQPYMFTAPKQSGYLSPYYPRF